MGLRFHISNKLPDDGDAASPLRKASVLAL